MAGNLRTEVSLDGLLVLRCLVCQILRKLRCLLRPIYHLGDLNKLRVDVEAYLVVLHRIRYSTRMRDHSSSCQLLSLRVRVTTLSIVDVFIFAEGCGPHSKKLLLRNLEVTDILPRVSHFFSIDLIGRSTSLRAQLALLHQGTSRWRDVVWPFELPGIDGHSIHLVEVLVALGVFTVRGNFV